MTVHGESVPTRNYREGYAPLSSAEVLHRIAAVVAGAPNTRDEVRWSDSFADISFILARHDGKFGGSDRLADD